MLISIVVPAFNEEKLLASVLSNLRRSASAFEGGGWSFELIVCDNNSTDRTARLAEESGARVVFEPVNQIGRARNRGAAGASGEWLIFVDADSWPSRELFEEIRRLIEGGRVVGGGAVVRYDERVWWSDFLVGCWNSISRLMGWAAGSLVFVESSAFRSVGGFSSELYASEEIDLSRKLKKWGRNSGRTMSIIVDFPLKTSARKIRLHGLGAHLRLLSRGILSPRGFPRTKDACAFWYDGKR